MEKSDFFEDFQAVKAPGGVAAAGFRSDSPFFSVHQLFIIL